MWVKSTLVLSVGQKLEGFVNVGTVSPCVRYLAFHLLYISFYTKYRQSNNHMSNLRHNYTDIEMFPDASLDETGNGCRNPSGQEDAPWCFTTDPTVLREYCQLPLCQGLYGTKIVTFETF